MANEERMMDLEVQLMHLQRQYDALNEVVTDQADRIDALVRANKRLGDKLEAMAASDSPKATLEDEKPPHY